MRERIQAFDWLRGIAIVAMVQTHAFVLLLPSIRGTDAFNALVRLDGLVAPSFIFSAGFAVALVTMQAMLSGTLKERAKKTLKRIGEVLLVATFINFIWFPLLREPKWIFRIDILQCIGLSLILAVGLLLALSRWPRSIRWMTLGLALLVFFLAPLFENVSGLGSVFLNSQIGFLDPHFGTTFPLLPWSGYVFLGASFGATVALRRSERELWIWLGLLMALGALLWWQSAALSALYPPHQFWVTNPANAAQRWTKVLMIVAVFRAIERLAPSLGRAPALRWLGSFGAMSLSAYFFHLMLLHQRHVGIFTRFFSDRCDWTLYALLVVLLIAATWVCCKVWDRIERTFKGWLARPATTNSQ